MPTFIIKVIRIYSIKLIRNTFGSIASEKSLSMKKKYSFLSSLIIIVNSSFIKLKLLPPMTFITSSFVITDLSDV